MNKLSCWIWLSPPSGVCPRASSGLSPSPEGAQSPGAVFSAVATEGLQGRAEAPSHPLGGLCTRHTLLFMCPASLQAS